ncbi:DNA cytosine methyltransferase [Pseudomonas sp. DWP3-1-2]|uniref:DNA cytosine methyltransferase n=1 Tax=Pseudomonas sp. DWP3-1-2 TaxID=2804645 RepID=UPI003CE91E2D
MGFSERPERKGTFIDLFSGCGGLSLGLMQAGWDGLFAIEKTAGAYKTLEHNLILGTRYKYQWPEWLPQINMEVSHLIDNFQTELVDLRGKVDLIAGGPPCQGFSHAGKRDPNDPRNKLAEQYIKVVEIVQPKYLLLENVRGFNTKFKNSGGQDSIPYSLVVKKRLEALGYGVSFRIIKSSEWGVPQHRPRFIMIAKRNTESDNFDPFIDLEKFRRGFLVKKGLCPDKPVSVRDAIGDLEVTGKSLVPNLDSGRSGFVEAEFVQSSSPSNYLQLLQSQRDSTPPNSLRLAKHSEIVSSRFQLILDKCERGVTISDEFRTKFNIKKQAITPLDGDLPSATVTTLPDDILHYLEPRILTVRENARLQSFPDWFAFQGVYTTGGKQRKYTCPRYTQVGNAVPPILAEALGMLLDRHERSGAV